MNLEFTASEPAAKALSELGRTEDVKFSPDHRRLAIVGYNKNAILLIDVEITGKTVALTDCVELKSSCLSEPHGIDFIDQDTVVVANRKAGAPILRLPPRGAGAPTLDVSPVSFIRGSIFNRVKSPGSVAVSKTDGHGYEVLICNNLVHRVTRHVLGGRGGIRVKSNEVLLAKGLNIPDGVAISHDRRWIAISNHETHSVFLFENVAGLNRNSEPSCVLQDMEYPHGVRFTPDDRHVVVADAGAPYVNVYAKGDGNWRGTVDPIAKYRVMDEETFARGRYNPQEGGPKGIDIENDKGVVVVTSHHQVLAFFDLSGILGSTARVDRLGPAEPELMLERARA